jgi:ATP:ADP antiporter, AAA family
VTVVKVIVWIRRSLDLRPGEAAAVAWAAVMFFAVLASYYVLRPVRDAFVLDGDPNFVVWLFTAVFVLMLAIAPPWGAAVARWPRHKLVPIAYRAMIAQLVLFAAVIAAGTPTTIVSKVFYIWVSMYNLFVVSVFWSLCADIARPEQGRRLFGLIAAGGTVGALTGPALTKYLAAHVDIWALLLISAAFLELAVWLSRRLDRADRSLQARRAAEATAAVVAPPPEIATAIAADRAIGGSPFAGLTRVLASPYLSGIGLYMIFTATLATFVYFRQLPIVKDALPDRVARTVFYADLELWSSLITLVIQLLVTARVLRWLGVGVVLALLPLAQGTGAILLATVPTLYVVSIVSPVGRALTHSLSRPSRELLFTAVAREDKFKSKNVIDTFAYRLGDFVSAWLHRGLTAAGIAASFAIVPIAVAWVVLSIALGLGYRRRTSSERSPQ